VGGITLHEGISHTAAAGIEHGTEALLHTIKQTQGARAAQAVDNLIKRGLVVVGATGMVKAAKGVRGTIGGVSKPYPTTIKGEAGPAPATVVHQGGGGQLAPSHASLDPTMTVRERVFGTNDVAEFSSQRLRPINGQMPDNYSLAGKTYNFENVKCAKLKSELRQKYPHGVPFTGNGFPDFSRYAVKKVKISMTGENYKDFRAANIAAGFTETPSGYTWHHHFDGEMMHLIPSEIHARSAVPHTGGAAIVKAKK
ncbi:MAG: HNH endonuclease, partial [Alphaproteobacteria bacterium]|nr:HNH endonuclease [Alphaproteobacteria bacterium]